MFRKLSRFGRIFNRKVKQVKKVKGRRGAHFYTAARKHLHRRRAPLRASPAMRVSPYPPKRCRLCVFIEKKYTHLMEQNISFHKSAFKHDVTEADVRWAFKTFVFEEPIEGEEDKDLLVGYDLAGNPLEILFNEVGKNAYYVFHAMKCRKQLREIADI
jgi:hypothetical protein